MSTTVGRNSLIMACGTAASRVTGQIRTIFLVGALGTTGIAANAYQAGAQIPQVIFNLLSTGVFNAVLVPQIVRTLKQKDADERLSKLITLSIALLLAITLLMASGTPLLTMLYLDSSWTPAQRALANAFTLWCMPQILFYGLYTVLGQILAAKGRFATYAWSSVGANVISCIGFGAFIMLFGNAGRQPMSFWTSGKIALTAGAWTAGVAFQALVLFIPLLRCGIHYRPRWGLHGLGLRSMGQVAVWSIAMVLLNQLMGIVNSRVNTGAPTAGGDLYGIAGNASYQYAYTIRSSLFDHRRVHHDRGVPAHVPRDQRASYRGCPRRPQLIPAIHRSCDVLLHRGHDCHAGAAGEGADSVHECAWGDSDIRASDRSAGGIGTHQCVPAGAARLLRV